MATNGIVFDFPACVAQDVWQLRCLAFERGNTAALNAVVRSFVSGTFTHVIKTCHEAFESGTDLDDETVNMMRHVFEARLALMGSIPSCPDDTADMEAGNGSAFLRMVGDLQFADENLSPFSSALFVLDDDAYDDIVHEAHRSTMCVSGEWWMVTGDEWFCVRNRVDQHVPRGWIEFLLSEMNPSKRQGE